MTRILARRAALATVATCALLSPLAAAPAYAGIVAAPVAVAASDAAIALTPIGSYETGIFDASAAEIVTFHGERMFVVNAQAGDVEVLDFSDPGSIAKVASISVDGIANSVAVRADGLGVIAVESPVKTDPGHLAFFDAGDPGAGVIGTVQVGALPDMVTITSDGKYALVADEGEPSDDFTIDPEGSVSIVRLDRKLRAPKQQHVKTADFHAFEDDLPEGVRVFGPTPHGDDRPVSRNLEPEYIAVIGDLAYVALQEANAVAVVHIPSAKAREILPLGLKDFGVTALDPSDRDGDYALRTYPGLFGVYMPDGIASYEAGGRSYFVTANEGDAREWGEYAESVRVKNLAKDGYGAVDPESPLAAYLGDADLGRLNVSIEGGFNAETGYYEELHGFGGRSFSIWTTEGEQVFDSGSDFERITAEANGEFLNSNHSEANLEGRSDDKGPEPENLVLGEVDGRTYAFIGLERVGGIMVYDITDPARASFAGYVNNRDFSVSVEDGGALADAGDLGAEGLAFLPADASPTGTPMTAVANEVSGTTTLVEVTAR
ncbi:choice-of-anchor I family protein [Microbacterium sp. YJN-G]|uniref:choice-of-anchor I family protein n=1 Tax=Microbacterium sp. YJN-G TaxID=2763257 RepID=UPI001878253F|nr:choice-of-anchor I family protein [Microbacterium sp. YJN-G]